MLRSTYTIENMRSKSHIPIKRRGPGEWVNNIHEERHDRANKTAHPDNGGDDDQYDVRDLTAFDVGALVYKLYQGDEGALENPDGR